MINIKKNIGIIIFIELLFYSLLLNGGDDRNRLWNSIYHLNTYDKKKYFLNENIDIIKKKGVSRGIERRLEVYSNFKKPELFSSEFKKALLKDKDVDTRVLAEFQDDVDDFSEENRKRVLDWINKNPEEFAPSFFKTIEESKKFLNKKENIDKLIEINKLYFIGYLSPIIIKNIREDISIDERVLIEIAGDLKDFPEENRKRLLDWMGENPEGFEPMFFKTAEEAENFLNKKENIDKLIEINKLMRVLRFRDNIIKVLVKKNIDPRVLMEFKELEGDPFRNLNFDKEDESLEKSSVNSEEKIEIKTEKEESEEPGDEPKKKSFFLQYKTPVFLAAGGIGLSVFLLNLIKRKNKKHSSLFLKFH